MNKETNLELLLDKTSYLLENYPFVEMNSFENHFARIRSLGYNLEIDERSHYKIIRLSGENYTTKNRYIRK